MSALDFEQRILRFLAREEEDEERSFRDLRALAAEQRVLEGECIRGARFDRVAGELFVFQVDENLSKFRNGDPVFVGDGIDFDASCQLVFDDYDPVRAELTLSRDRFLRFEELRFDAGTSYCVDRRPLGLRGRLREIVRAGFADPHIRSVLEGDHTLVRDDARHERAVSALRETELNEAQLAAGAAAMATESLALVQGPPGTGKTRLLAEIVSVLVRAGCHIALVAYTHRAVDNALRAIRAIDPKLLLVKVGNAGSGARELRRLGVQMRRRPSDLPHEPAVVAGTCFALAKVAATDRRFHITVFDEAGQMPIAHALPGMLVAKRWILFGDHRQLAPVITAEHADREVAVSAFARLHELYGGHLLDTSYRMNGGVCDVVSRTFYAGKLVPAESVAERVMPFRGSDERSGGEFTKGCGVFDEILDPKQPVVFARIDHRQPGTRSPEEANLVADLLAETVTRHRIAPEDIAVIAPFRAQVRQIRAAIRKRTKIDPDALVVDTVERIQGQEREVVFVSLAVGDPDTLDRRGAFFFSPNRLNVALSRARTKVVLIASSGAFDALPRDAASLRAASVYKALRARLPEVDMTGMYRSGSVNSPSSGCCGEPRSVDG